MLLPLISVFEAAAIEPRKAGHFGIHCVGGNPANFARVLPINAVKVYVDFPVKPPAATGILLALRLTGRSSACLTGSDAATTAGRALNPLFLTVLASCDSFHSPRTASARAGF